jgi:hypothetical protein
MSGNVEYRFGFVRVGYTIFCEMNRFLVLGHGGYS